MLRRRGAGKKGGSRQQHTHFDDEKRLFLHFDFFAVEAFDEVIHQLFTRRNGGVRHFCGRCGEGGDVRLTHSVGRTLPCLSLYFLSLTQPLCVSAQSHCGEYPPQTTHTSHTPTAVTRNAHTHTRTVRRRRAAAAVHTQTAFAAYFRHHRPPPNFAQRHNTLQRVEWRRLIVKSRRRREDMGQNRAWERGGRGRRRCGVRAAPGRRTHWISPRTCSREWVSRSCP